MYFRSVFICNTFVSRCIVVNYCKIYNLYYINVINIREPNISLARPYIICT